MLLQKVIAVCSAVILGLSPGLPQAAKAQGLILSEVKALLTEGDHHALHRRFAEHRAAFAAGKLNGYAFTLPFRAFHVYSAERVQTISDWRRAYPDDAAARAAEAAHHHHVSVLLNVHGFDGGWSRIRRARWEAAVERAAAGYAAALEANPAQIFAAREMHWLDRGIVGSVRWQAATTAMETHAPPALATEWRLAAMGRAAQHEAVQPLCESVAGSAPGLTREACYAVALIRFKAGHRREVLEMMEAADAVAFPRQQLFAMRLARRPLDERVAFSRRHGARLHLNDYMALSSGSVDGAIHHGRDLLAEALTLDPENPLLTAKYAWILAFPDSDGPRRGRWARILGTDRTPAVELTKRLLARHDHAIAPYNAALWRAVDWALPRHSGAMLPFVERAIHDSENDPDAWLFAGRNLIDPKEWIGIGPDYRPLPSFECRKRNVLRLVGDACAGAGGDHEICQPDGLEQVAAQLNDIATLGQLDCSAAPDLGMAMPAETLEEDG
ncbi:MAG: hypothetical protein AAF968_03970 [Pseudomonadota bacterium]